MLEVLDFVTICSCLGEGNGDAAFSNAEAEKTPSLCTLDLVLGSSPNFRDFKRMHISSLLNPKPWLMSPPSQHAQR